MLKRDTLSPASWGQNCALFLCTCLLLLGLACQGNKMDVIRQEGSQKLYDRGLVLLCPNTLPAVLCGYLPQSVMQDLVYWSKRDLKVMGGVKPMFAEYLVILHNKILSSRKPLSVLIELSTYISNTCISYRMPNLERPLRSSLCVSEPYRLNSFA